MAWNGDTAVHPNVVACVGGKASSEPATRVGGVHIHTRRKRGCGRPIKEHYVSSWTLAEYHQALQDEESKKLVTPSLDDATSTLADWKTKKTTGVKSRKEHNVGATSSTLVNNSSELITSKYYFAGESVRFMFNRKTEGIVKELKRAVNSMPNIEDLASRLVGDQSPSVVNRLFGRYRCADGLMRSELISRYAAAALAIFEGPELIKKLATMLQEDSNPALDGWIQEFKSMSLHVYAKAD